MSRHRAKQPQCTNPEIGKKIFIQIMDTGLNEGKVALAKEYEDHIRECPYCSSLVPLWKIKAGGGLLADAKQVLAEANEGRADVLHKRAGNLDVYFKRSNRGSAEGLLVKTRGGGEIVSVDESSIESFEALSA